MKRWALAAGAILVVGFLTLKHYLIHRPVELPVNNLDPS